MRANTFNKQSKNPSFSSSLLDEIYRSISESDVNHQDFNFFRAPMPQYQTKSTRLVDQDRRACLFDKCIDRKIGQNRKPRHVFEEDEVFFSSTSLSSDSSSGRFSSSDTDSFSGATLKSKPKPKSSVSAPVPPIRRRPVKTLPEKPEKTEAPINGSILKSKSRALKLYNNLKNLKQPISPGGKLSNFINSIFNKSKHSSSIVEERKLKSKQASTCASAQSFSRSCLSKPEKFRDGVQRSVQFYPASVIADKEYRPCGHKSLYGQQDSQLLSVSFPTAWKIGKSPKKIDNDLKYQVMDKSRKIEEVARDFLREYQKKNANNLIDEDEDDDAKSDSSSDLFELDNLSLIGKDGGYSEELPVYETTHISSNRAIAKGLRF